MSGSDSDKADHLHDASDKTDLKGADREELDAESTMPSIGTTSTAKNANVSAELSSLKNIADSRHALVFSLSDDEDESDLSPTPTTERLCSKNSVVPNSASAEGDIGRVAARIAKAKQKKENMTFNFPEPEFLNEIPKYDREYEDHELEDASDLVPMLLSAHKIQIPGIEQEAQSKLAKLSLSGQKD